MIVLVVHYNVRPGTEGQAVAYIRRMQEHTRREPGCRLYFGHQLIDNPRCFLFYEQYDSRAALDAHRAAPYFEQNITNGLAKLAENISRELFGARRITSDAGSSHSDRDVQARGHRYAR